MNKPHIIRHGEAVIKPIDSIPSNAKLIETVANRIVAHSESGHHHVLEALSSKKDIRVYELDGELYLDVKSQSNLVHKKEAIDKHQTQEVVPGKYKIIIKKEFNYFKKAMQRVQD